ncbi:hypothetical protein H181DRAFT_00474 [Streptomyces sp. WMMB 714]|nr:hypothetical protein H181DRAFT_00474 [Streptomyces sp. WMMB 714]
MTQRLRSRPTGFDHQLGTPSGSVTWTVSVAPQPAIADRFPGLAEALRNLPKAAWRTYTHPDLVFSSFECS